jgi:uncharacterized protein
MRLCPQIFPVKEKNMTKEAYTMLENYMLSCMEDSAHDAEHIYRVLYNALQIARDEENVNYDILIAACLLHDIGRKEQFADSSLCHAAVGAEKARRFLTENGFAPGFAEAVAHCIRTHRFRKAMPPQTVEAKILFDADKLDVTGAIGIARTLMYKADMAEPLYHVLPDGRISDGTEDLGPSFFREYKFKLERLYDKFYTARGEQMAQSRRKIAVAFYESLYQEVNEGYTSGKEMLCGYLEGHR